VAIIEGEYPLIQPMGFVLHDERLYLHGSTMGRLMTRLAEGSPACIQAMILDGLVLARSAYNHSMNYRCVTIFGKGTAVNDVAKKNEILKALSDKYALGRWPEIRPPSEAELKVTLVVEFSTETISGKSRTGPPKDLEKDMELSVWAGEIPYCLQALQPVADPQLSKNVHLPDYLLHLNKP
jgi:nitroimidazol reductase NimA-like FMN-containing flavoprotein (pyridoxamine 5'-phosphate oxidase superfamily)